jgi:O-methyltransferase
MSDTGILNSRSLSQSNEATSLYIDLMKRCLTDSIYLDDMLSNYVFYQQRPSVRVLRRIILTFVDRFLSVWKIRLVRPYSDLSPQDVAAARETGGDWPTRAHTMIGMKRLNNLQNCIESVIGDGIPGDFIETGVWRGGACIFMRAILKAYGEDARTVWLADSFAGLPPPNAEDYPADDGDTFHTHANVLAVSRDRVAANFRKYGLFDDQVRFIEGWFKDSLPNAPIERLAILRLDGDMYESTIQALDALYTKVSVGGYVIVDDYFLEPCKKAVQDFRNTHDIDDEIIDVDGIGSFWRRSK